MHILIPVGILLVFMFRHALRKGARKLRELNTP
jgi:hypothetical protein